MAIYDLTRSFDKQSFSKKVMFYLEKGCRVELIRKTNRTRAQNSYLHLILSFFALESGNKMEYVKDEYFKRLCNRELFVTTKNDPYLGKIEVLRSSKQLTIEQMSIAITRFRDWSSSEAGIYLPSADEQEHLNQIEQILSSYTGQEYN